MADIMQILADDHENMGALMGLLEVEVDKMADGQHADVDLIAAIADYMLEYPDRFHHPIEDMIVESMRAAGAVPPKVAQTLESAHARISKLAHDLHEAAIAIAAEQPMRRDTFVETARTYIDALREHMRAEDRDFFPRAAEALSAADRAALAERLPDFEDPLFGGATRDRYRRLSETLLTQ